MLDWIKELPDTSTPLNKEFFQKLANSILDSAFPIGKTEIFYDNDDHSNYLGFNWERTAIGKAIVGIDSSDTDFNEIGKTGGEKNHTLTVDEMPKHTHTMALEEYGAETASGITYKFKENTGYYNNGDDMIKYSGGSQEHNNLQPYQVFAIWKRIE